MDCQHQQSRLDFVTTEPTYAFCKITDSAYLCRFNNPTLGKINKVFCLKHISVMKEKLKRFEKVFPDYSMNFEVLETFYFQYPYGKVI